MNLGMLLLAVDPGKRNGVAIFDMSGKEGELKYNETLSVDELIRFITGIEELKEVVVEDYISRPGVNHGRGEAMQVIGILKALAFRLGCPLTRQRPEARLHAAKWAGEAIPRSHMPDKQSARLHGIYRLRELGKFTTVLERKKRNGNEVQS